MFRSFFTLVGRLLQGDFFVFFGRFRLFRLAFGRIKGASQRLGRKSALAPDHPSARPSLLPDIDLDNCLASLRQDGFHLGPHLDDRHVEEIRAFARHAPCTRPGFDEHFLVSEVENGRLADGRPVSIADVRDVATCPVIQTIAYDPTLLRVAREYMGFWPDFAAQRLFWSLASDLPPEVRRETHQTIDFHYDVQGYSSFNVYFYLTHTDRDSGAHVVVKGSHSRKPLSALFASRLHADGPVCDFYGLESAVTVEGRSGFGFLEDPSCFHKALPPKSDHRLVLQIRYQSMEKRLDRAAAGAGG